MLLIINPRATSMTGRDAGLVVRALGSRLELDTRQTQYRGHARKLAAASAADGYDLVVTFSGDELWTNCRWKGKDDLSALKGKYLELAIKLRSAKIFAYRFT